MSALQKVYNFFSLILQNINKQANIPDKLVAIGNPLNPRYLTKITLNKILKQIDINVLRKIILLNNFADKTLVAISRNE